MPPKKQPQKKQQQKQKQQQKKQVEEEEEESESSNNEETQEPVTPSTQPTRSKNNLTSETDKEQTKPAATAAKQPQKPVSPRQKTQQQSKQQRSKQQQATQQPIQPEPEPEPVSTEQSQLKQAPPSASEVTKAQAQAREAQTQPQEPQEPKQEPQKQPPKQPVKEKEEKEKEEENEDEDEDEDKQQTTPPKDENEDEEEDTQTVSKKEEKKLNKLRKAGKLTTEEYQRRMGLLEPSKPQLTEEEMKKVLKDQEKVSGVIGMQVKKGGGAVAKSLGKDVKVEGFTLAYKSMMLLKDCDLTIVHGRKYGLIGPNGTGKSTLLRHISQRHLPIQENIQILHVEQEIEGTDQIALDAVVEADVERMDLLKELKELSAISEENTEEGLKAHERTIEIHKRLRAIGAHSAEARAAAILSGLQFTVEMQKKRTKEFSGGWRMRISLARALFVLPDLLLLDEPTNHLDLDAVIWLEAYLKKYKKTLLLVSHDRDFLNGVVTDIICIVDQKLIYYRGNYDSYEKGETQKKKTQEAAYKVQQKKIADLNKKQTENARDQKKKIEKKGIVEKVGKDYSVKFIFRDPGPLGYPVIQIKKVSFGYKPGEENLLFKKLELNVDLDSRIAIVGPNGAGKSTLMNLILGELKPTEGEILRNHALRVAKFSQHFVDQLNMVDTPVEYIAKKFPEMKLQEVRNKLGMYNLKGDLHNQRISLLSGGQKSRVAMAEIGLKMPHIFFLDEPTNHLDIQSVDALSEALQEFKGGVVLITHDQRLVSTVAKELWVCRGDGGVEKYDGTFDDYKQEIIDRMPDELFLDSDEEK